MKSNKKADPFAHLQLKKWLFSPSKVLATGFLLLIGLGTALLCLPVSVTGQPLSFFDGLFTATSCVCITGLTVVQPGVDLTLFGQIVMITLIQVGGLGFMAFGTFFLVLLKKRISLTGRLILSDSLNEDSPKGMVNMTLRILKLTFLIEGCGAVALLPFMIRDFGVKKGIWASLFHAISAFCNAGFDLAGGMEHYKNDIFVLFILMALITIGGLGFSVLFDLKNARFRFKKLALHSKLVLIFSAILTFGGGILFLLFEFTNPQTLSDPEMLPYMRPVNALFESVALRTAGFQTFLQQDMRPGSFLTALLLMFIGASPASTGGGLKTTTIGIFFLLIWNILRGREKIVVFGRTVRQSLINRAIVLLTLAVTVVLIAYLLLTVLLPPSEAVTPGHILYECISAFGTVGLTIGVTAELTNLGKIILCLLMFAGRVGLLTLALALTNRKQTVSTKAEYPEGKIMIG